MTGREILMRTLSQKPNLIEMYVLRFAYNIRQWDKLVNDPYSGEPDFEECLANWHKLKNECRYYFTPKEIDELIDAALKRVAHESRMTAHETLQGITSNETTD